MKKSKVAVCSRSFSRHPLLRARLSARYDHVEFNDTGAVLCGEQLINFLSGYERAIVGLERLDRSILAQLPELKIISKYGVGLDSIDLIAMRDFGKRLGWTPGVNRRSVAELVLAFAISLLRKTHHANLGVRAGRWEQVIGRQLSGKTFGIIGCGNIGKDLVKILQPFNCELLVFDIVDYTDFFRDYAVKLVSLEFLLENSDIVSLHLPLDTTTIGILDSNRINMMKKGSILINTARGSLVDEKHLSKALKDGLIGAAAFDVFNIEPPTDFELMGMANFFATPHIGGSAEEAILAMGEAAIEGLEYNAIPSHDGKELVSPSHRERHAT